MAQEKTSTLPKWDLTDIAPDHNSQEHQDYLEKLNELVEDFVSKKESLKTITPEQFKLLVEEYNHIKNMNYRLGAYASSLMALNLKDQDAKALGRKYDELSSEISNKIRFFCQWFAKINENRAKELISALDVDKYTFTKIYENGKYMLSESEENIISIKETTGASALVNLYDMYRAAIRIDWNGEQKSLEEMRPIMTSQDRKVRKKAYELIKEEQVKHIDVVGDIYLALTKDYYNEVIKLRKYPSQLSARTTREGISEKAVLALMDAAKQSKQIFHEYFGIKAKLMGIPRLAGYDINVPYVITEEKKYAFDEAFKLVLEAANAVTPKYAEIFQELLDTNHIDAQIEQNKRGGAFCEFFGNGTNPYVFQQFQGKYDDLRTLAHELGHAMQGYFVKSLSHLSHHSSIGIAESTSTFMEEVLFEEELKTASPERKKELLVQSVFECFATIQLQVYVAISEIEYHNEIAQGVGHEKLTDIWTDLTNDLFGPHVNKEDKSLSWAYRPHIYHSPFYCYNYGIGQILALIFIKQWKDATAKGPEALKEWSDKFTQYMAVGGTASSVDTAKIMGIDLEDPNTWLQGYALVQERLDELKKIIG